MHDIEPFWKWRDQYVAAEDSKSPFHGRKYSEMYFTKQIYNFVIHPQWDGFGSSTVYLKVIFADYQEKYALIELIGEWNDTLHNDVSFFKRRVIEPMMNSGIQYFIFFCENLLQFHGGDVDYYEEWAEEMRDERGWAAYINVSLHVEEEMHDSKLQFYLNFGENFNDINWRIQKPQFIFEAVNALVNGQLKRIR
jgi:hypothetical protein